MDREQMSHYRLYKLSKKTGKIISGKDMEEANDDQAVCEAHKDPDCPECELWKADKLIAKID